MKFENIEGKPEVVNLECRECGESVTERACGWNSHKTIGQLKAGAICNDCKKELRKRRR